MRLFRPANTQQVSLFQYMILRIEQPDHALAHIYLNINNLIAQGYYVYSICPSAVYWS